MTDVLMPLDSPRRSCAVPSALRPEAPAEQVNYLEASETADGFGKALTANTASLASVTQGGLCQSIESGSASGSVPASPEAASLTTSSKSKIRLRHGFIELVHEHSCPLKRSSSAPHLSEDEEPGEQLHYLEQLEARASSLRSIANQYDEAKAAPRPSADRAYAPTLRGEAGCLPLGEPSLAEPREIGPQVDGLLQATPHRRGTLQDCTALRLDQQHSARHGEGGQQSGEASSSLSPELITTLMICNLPYRVTKEDLMDAVDRLCFEGCYDFCHVPTAQKKGSKVTNLGYAFINFVSSAHASAFVSSFGNFRFLGNSSTKQCTLRPARLQGRAANEYQWTRHGCSFQN